MHNISIRMLGMRLVREGGRKMKTERGCTRNHSGVGGLGLYPFNIKKNISRTKFESAQKRDALEFFPRVARLGA